MCGPLNTTAVNGYTNQDSHAVSRCILFFSVSKRRLDKGYLRNLHECKSGSQPFCCSCCGSHSLVYCKEGHARKLSMK